MLKDLKILNGELELKFNEYTYEYTVLVGEEISNLDFSYELSENTFIKIRNNYILNDESIVYVDVYNEVDSNTYTFYVYKENSEVVNSIEEYVTSLAINKKENVEEYKVQLLIVSIFIILIFLFSIIFKRSKHN